MQLMSWSLTAFQVRLLYVTLALSDQRSMTKCPVRETWAYQTEPRTHRG